MIHFGSWFLKFYSIFSGALSSGARVEWTIKMAGVQQRLLILLEPRSRELERIARGLE